MIKELTAAEVLYEFDISNIELRNNNDFMPEYKDVYEKIKTSIEIDEFGYDLYLIDDFSKDKLNNLIKYMEGILKHKDKPRDICYIVKEEEKYPEPIYLNNGNGNKLKEQLKSIKEAYDDLVFKFYNSSINQEKEDLLDYIGERKSELVNELIDIAKKEGFDIRASESGFTFIPLKDGRVMTEDEYDELESEKKESIISKVSELKSKTKTILAQLKVIEENEIDKIKVLMKEHLKVNIEDLKKDYKEAFKNDTGAVEYLDFVCENIEKSSVDNYTSSFSEDEEKIKEIINKYKINVLLDNSEVDAPRVIYEEDPTIGNILGNIEYVSDKGNYKTDVSLIKSGSMLRAIDGCLIIRINSLLNNPLSYYYLKKALMTRKIDYNYNKGYLELLSLNGLKPQPIEFKEKVILIGDYRSYSLLYNYDEDFKKIFKMRAESNPTVEVDKEIKESLIRDIVFTCKKKKFKPLTNGAIKEVAKYLSRMASNKKKLYYNNDELCNLLTLANNKVKNEGKHNMDAEDIINAAYPKEVIEKAIMDNYKDKTILVNVKGSSIGEVNGLSVIDLGYVSLGKPIRITCTCYKGEGNIVDVQKESSMSGNIHCKSIGILTGFMNHFIGGYNKIPVDFHLSFEQIYGLIDGDSASVAEVISMISALSMIPVKQNIAVTGSINQFGQIQPIGGVNEKIEGFYKVCKLIDKIDGKGVVIPHSNLENLVLSKEVEADIASGKFKIYTMKSIDDAIEVLIDAEECTAEKVLQDIKREIRKYSGKKNKKE